VTKVQVNETMDIGIVVAVAMLVLWAVLTFLVNDAPGITHALLIAGLTLLIWRVVKRDAPAARDR
jgi:threonine/homoserine/homoserine lactone efflux protein